MTLTDKRRKKLNPIVCLCGSCNTTRLAKHEGLDIHYCLGCSQIYANPYFSDDELVRYYEDYRTEDSQQEFDRRVTVKGPKILQRLRHLGVSGKRIIAIGCGSGGILVPLRQAGAAVMGYDIDQKAASFGRRQGLNIQSETLPWGPFDIVILSHVLEHLRQPDRLLTELKTQLNPKGVLYIEVPNVKPSWRGLKPHLETAHCWYFDRDTMTSLLNRCGYRVVSEPESSVPWAMIFIAEAGSPLADPSTVRRKLKAWRLIERARRFLGK